MTIQNEVNEIKELISYVKGTKIEELFLLRLEVLEFELLEVELSNREESN